MDTDQCILLVMGNFFVLHLPHSPLPLHTHTFLKKFYRKSSNGIPTGDSYNVQQAFESLFHQYGVDVYFDGHVHGYERTYPVYQSQVYGTNTLNEYYNPPATVYVVNGNAGVSQFSFPLSSFFL